MSFSFSILQSEPSTAGNTAERDHEKWTSVSWELHINRVNTEVMRLSMSCAWANQYHINLNTAWANNNACPSVKNLLGGINSSSTHRSEVSD